MITTELWVDMTNLRNTKVVQTEAPELSEGDILVAIEKFAITANNVGYAVSGNIIGYWKYFPTDDQPWGKVTVWGMADVLESRCEGIQAGERLYGFFPMSTHLKMTPSRVRDDNFIDGAAHRLELPALYNHYSRTKSEPIELQAIEDARCIFFPLFITGYVIADFLMDNEWFGAEQIVVGSVSSKTGYGLAAFIKANGFQGNLIGITSGRNKEFVESLELCDQITTYDEIEGLNQVPTAFIDMAGDGPIRARLHHHLGDNMKTSQIVGITHWDSEQINEKLPGSKPTFFFTPTQIEKRSKDWGPGVLEHKGYAASAGLVMKLKDQLKLEFHQGGEACASIWADMLDNKISGQQGIMVSLQEKDEENA